MSPLQVKLKPLTPQTEEEKIEHSIAAERRRMRLVHKETLKDLLTRSPRETGTVSRSPGFQSQNSPDAHRLTSSFLGGMLGRGRVVTLFSSAAAELETRDGSAAVPAEKTRVESVELVLPPHANHQGNTFGGQIMAWMENVATIAAR